MPVSYRGISLCDILQSGEKIEEGKQGEESICEYTWLFKFIMPVTKK